MTIKKRLRRWEASKFLRETVGLQISPSTLANLASLGEGPAYVRAGRFAEYEPADLTTWGQSRITRKTARASELRDSHAA
jgi:hypothetical protein